VLNAAEFIVDNENPNCNDSLGNPFCKISTALKKAIPDTTINISAGLYLENILIDKNITLLSMNNGVVTINGMQKSHVVLIEPGIKASIIGLHLINGKASNGGGILNNGELTIENVNIENNIALLSGGGIYNARSISGNLIIRNARISHNSALGDDKYNVKYGGGGISNEAPLEIFQSEINHNFAKDNGGGIYSVFSGRRHASAGQIAAEKLGISSAPDRMKSLTRKSDSNSVKIINTKIMNNVAEAGGGVNVHGVLNMENSLVDSNQAINGSRSAGGGIFGHFDTALILTNTIISHNIATFRGGGLRFYSTNFGQLFNVSIVDNHVLERFGGGAGLYLVKGTKRFEMKNSLIVNNQKNEITSNCLGTINSNGYNVISKNQKCQFVKTKGDQELNNKKSKKLYRWDDAHKSYSVIANAYTIDTADPDGCKGEGGKLIKQDIYAHDRHIDAVGDGKKRCDIGAIEYVAGF